MNRAEWESYFDGVRKEDWVAVRGLLEGVAEKEKNNPSIFLKLGDLYRRSGDAVDAVKQYYKAAQLLMSQGFKKRAIEIYKIILDLDEYWYKTEAADGCRDLIFELDEEEKSLPRSPDNKEASQASADTATSPLAGKSGIPAIPEFFSGMSGAEFEDLLKGAVVHSFSGGDKIVGEGDSGDSVFLVKSGRARAVVHMLGKEISLSILWDGDVFGEIAFLTGRPRTATVIADGPVSVYEIGRSAIEAAIEKHPEMMARIEDLQRSRAADTIRRTVPGTKAE